MDKKRKRSAAIPWLLLLLGICFVLLLAGCTTFRDLASWVSFANSERGVERIEDNDLAKFTSTIRPQLGDANSIYNLACYFQERKKHQLAVAEFRKVVRIDPTHAQAYNGLGVSYDNLKEFPRAIQAYKTALALNPDLDCVQNNLGYSYLLQEEFEPAIEAFRNAITLSGTNKRYHNNLGMAYAENGQFGLAFEEFKLAGGEAKAHTNMAQFFYEKGLYPEARIHFAKASGLHPGDGETRNALTAAENLAKITQPKHERIPEPSPVTSSGEVNRDVSVKYEGAAPSAVAMAGAERMETRESETAGQEIVQKIRTSDTGGSRLNHVVGDFTGLEHRGGESANSIGMVYAKETKTETPTPEFIGYIAIQDASSPNFPKETPLTSRLYPLTDWGIEISNGNGVRHMARRIGDFLMEKGLEKPFLTNAVDFNQPETIVYYREGYLQEAYRVAKEIPGYQNMEKVAGFRRPGINVRVLIGKDLILFDDLFINRQWIS